MAQILRVPLQGIEQVAKHPVVGLDLLAFPPAGHQSGAFIQGGVDQMRDAGQVSGKLLAGDSVSQVQGEETRAMRVVGRAPRQSDDVAIGIGAEMPDRRVAHEPAGARDQDLLARHGSGLVRMRWSGRHWFYAPVTRQIALPTSSATRSEPSGPRATPTGRP